MPNLRKGGELTRPQLNSKKAAELQSQMRLQTLQPSLLRKQTNNDLYL